MNNTNSIVVVGGGQAGAQTIASLRQNKCIAKITLIGNEDHPPYQRPPLSKLFLKGELPAERLLVKPLSWYASNDVALHLNTRAETLDRSTQTIHCDDGHDHHYDRLVIATGSSPRYLGNDDTGQPGIYYLRDIAHVVALREVALTGRRVVIVGAGYIGLEAAASLRQMGLDVTVLEMAPRVLARVTSPMISEYYEALHTSRGVHILTATGLREFVHEDGVLKGVTLADGTTLDADIALIGIGIVPNDQLARDCGIECDNGILVDRDARTSDPNVFAVGDCAHRPLVHYARSGRLESVHNAIEQGKLAAAAIMELPRPKEDCPWFWSDQFDQKLQIAGLSDGYDELVVRGDIDEHRFAVFYLKDHVLIAVDAVNSPKEFMGAKALIANATRCDASALSDPDVLLKTLLEPAG